MLKPLMQQLTTNVIKIDYKYNNTLKCNTNHDQNANTIQIFFIRKNTALNITRTIQQRQEPKMLIIIADVS